MEHKVLSRCAWLCEQALPAHPFLSILPVLGGPGSPRCPNNSHTGLASSAKPVLEHQWILALSPTPVSLAACGACAISSVSAVLADLRASSSCYI